MEFPDFFRNVWGLASLEVLNDGTLLKFAGTCGWLMGEWIPRIIPM